MKRAKGRRDGAMDTGSMEMFAEGRAKRVELGLCVEELGFNGRYSSGL